MTTASHNPIQYNGFKISGPKAKPIGAASGLDDIKRIATHAAASGRRGCKGKLRGAGPLGAVPRSTCYQFLDLKRPLKVVVDASNGMAGKMVPAVFGDVPNLEIVPILFEITGSFVARAQPAGRVEPGHAQGEDDARRQARTSAPASTATPTGACSSTRTASSIGSRHDHRAARRGLPEAAGEQGRDDRLRPALEPRRRRTRSRRPAACRGATASATRSSRRRWPRPRPSSAASCPGTSTSATTSSPTRPPSRSRACCRSSARRTSRSSELMQPVLQVQPQRRDQLPGRGQGRARSASWPSTTRRPRSTTSTASRSTSATGGSTSARATPSRCCG